MNLPQWLQFAAPKIRKEPIYTEQTIRRALGLITSTPDIDEALRRAGVSRDKLKALEADDEVYQCLSTRRDAVIGTPWRLEPDNTRIAKALREIVAPHAETIVTGAWRAVMYGFAVQELICRREAGRVVIDQVVSHDLDRFKHDGRQWVYHRVSGADPVPLDPMLDLVTVHDGSHVNPYGSPLLAKLWLPVTWRLEGWQHWLHFLETFGMPMVIGQVVDYQGFVDAMVAQGVRTAVGFQSAPDDKISTITAAQSGEFERLERALTTRIQRLILGQTLTSDVGDSGSYAAAKVHNEVRDDKRIADLRMVTPTMQQVVNTLCAYNGWSSPPRVVFADDTGLEHERAERDKTLQEALSASGLRLTRNYYTDRYDLADEDLEDALQAAADGDVAGDQVVTDAVGRAAIQMAASGQTFTPVQQHIEDEVDRLAPIWPPQVPVEAIRSAIKGARDAEDLESRLAAALERVEIDTELFARAQFAAMVLGYVAAEERRT